MSQTLSQTITFYCDIDPYLPIVENITDASNSVFQNTYKKILQQIASIVATSNPPSLYEDTDYSNIVAITGERGSGKTSAMLSIANYLGLNDSHYEILADKYNYILNNSTFSVLPAINPAHITKDETVLDIILAQMYDHVEKKYKQDQLNTYSDMSSARELFASFEQVYHAVQIQCQNRATHYSYELKDHHFLDTASSVQLKRSLQSLIQQYLKFVRADNLILQIDDIDLNFSCGYDICEELRKYLSIHHVVILFAVNMDQLYSLIQQNFYRELDVLYHHGQDAVVRETVPEMSEQYLRKLIPTGRRCALPSVSHYALQNVMLQITGKSKSIQSRRPRPLVSYLLELFYKKAGLIFIAEHGQHPLLPNNLRGLHHLLALLTNMQDIHLFKDTTPIYSSIDSLFYTQLETIEQYFIDEVSHSLSEEEQNILRVFNHTPNYSLNQQLVRKLYHLLSLSKIETTSTRAEMLQNIQALTQIPVPENVTVGDLLYVLQIFDTISGIHPQFTALLKTLYSIRALKILFFDAENGKNNLFLLFGGSILSMQYHSLFQKQTSDSICNFYVKSRK